MRKLFLIFIGLIVVIVSAIYWKNITLQNDIGKAQKEFDTYIPPKIRNWGQVQKVSITPLIDWHTELPELKTEAGVS
jgi:hypothetical protein